MQAPTAAHQITTQSRLAWSADELAWFADESIREGAERVRVR